MSFKIKKGDRIAITGKTGSGKSTLLYLLLGLIKPDQGNVFFNNKNIHNDLSTWRKNGETISIIGNVRQTATTPPGQILITTKDDGEWTILYNIQTPKVNVTCIMLHGDTFDKVK